MQAHEYEAHDGVGLAELVARGELTASELLELAIERAEAINPRLNAIVIPMYEEARARVRAGLPEGPFHGVPFLLKDLLASYAGVPLRGASRLYRDYVPDHDSELVRRFKRAGLAIFGKTNASEFGILPVTEPELYGPTDNPWRPGYTAGGSSGGSAAAVAAGIVPVAHGGDGGGSLRIPASCCGVVGFKPSRGRTPCGPDHSEVMLGYAIEHVISRSVRDAAAMLDATTGPEVTARHHASAFEGTFRAAVERDPGPLRIAFTSEPLLPGETAPECRRAVEAAARLCESLGHTVEELGPRVDSHRIAKSFFRVYTARTAGVFAFSRELFGRPVRREDVELTTYLLGLLGEATPAGALMYAIDQLNAESREILRFFEDWDLLLTPTLGLPPVKHHALAADGLERRLHELVARLRLKPLLRLEKLVDLAVERAYRFAPFTMVFNVTGQPSISLPLHWSDDGLPIGVMCTGRLGEDACVLQLAAQLERARPWAARRPTLSR